jgi:hypothetical protein
MGHPVTRLVRLAAYASIAGNASLVLIAATAFRVGDALIHHTCGVTP